MKILPLFLYSAYGALFMVSLGCQSSNASTAHSAKAAKAPMELEIVKVKAQKLEAKLNVPAELTPFEVAEIHPKVTGYVKWVGVDRGSKVKKGALLAKLEAPEILAQRAEAESKLQAAQSQLAAAQAKLSAEQATFEKLTFAAKTPGAVAGNDLQIAARALESARSIVESQAKGTAAAKSALDAVAQMAGYLRITAPFDGTVTDRLVHPGALASAAMALFRLETTDRLRLVVPVSETSVSTVEIGEKISFTVPAYPKDVFQAPVTRISHAIDAKTRTMPVELDVANPKGTLTSGTFCQVQWPLRRSGMSLFVPNTAITTNQERIFVIRLKRDSAGIEKSEWVDVKSGATLTTPTGNLVEVMGALSENDPVVLRATDAIKPGMAVKAKGEAPKK